MFLKLEKKFITIDNGEKIAYIEKGYGKKVLVLIHGNFSGSYHYEPLYKLFDEEEYRVICPDLRGYGDSSYNKQVDSIHDFADDIVALLAKLNIDNIYLAGWSLGGCVAQSITARYPKLVNRLILIASGSVKGFPVFKKDSSLQNMVGKIYESKEELALDPVTVVPMVTAQKTKNYKFMESIWNLTIYTSLSQKRPDEISSQIFLEETCKQVNLVDADWALMRYNISNETSFYSVGENIAKNIVCPVLALNGRQDITVPEVMIRENRQYIPHLIQKYYDDCGHSILVDQIDLLYQDIVSFINQ